MAITVRKKGEFLGKSRKGKKNKKIYSRQATIVFNSTNTRRNSVKLANAF